MQANLGVIITFSIHKNCSIHIKFYKTDPLPFSSQTTAHYEEGDISFMHTTLQMAVMHIL